MHLYLHNALHLGDGLFAIWFLLHAIRHGHCSRATLYVQDCHIPQLREYETDSFKVGRLADKPSDAVDCWIGSKSNKVRRGDYASEQLDTFYRRFYRAQAEQLGFANYVLEGWPFSTHTSPALPAEMLSCQILVINSQPLSGQYADFYKPAVQQAWNAGIRRLAEHWDLWTTRAVPGVRCTLDRHLSVKQIGALAAQCRFVIAVSTGPLVACLHEIALGRVERWFVFGDKYTFQRFQTCVTFSEAENGISSLSSSDNRPLGP